MTGVEEILAGKYPAKEHARKVAEWIASNGGKKEGILYLEAQKLKYNEDNDQSAHFRQRRYFFYLSGCELPDCYLTYDMAADKLTLFIPPIDPEDVVWSGLPLSVEEALEQYDVDDVLTSTELNASLAHFATAAQGSGKQLTVYAIPNQVSEHVTFLPFDEKEFSLLKPAIDITRVIKSKYELALIHHANDVTAAAHTAVMKAARTAKNEQELEGLFLKTCIERGCREQAYSSIVASGTSAATLHYVRNDAPLDGKLNLLLDAGAEKRCYASDVTRTFPLGGKPFTKESKQIYDLVLQMQKTCIAMMHEGVLWEDVHSEAHKVAIKGLLDIGLLKGGSVDEIFKNRTSVAFFPHGLGHYLGMDTHDTGGNPNYSDQDAMFKYLRVRGTLPAGSVITVEPGVYFCRFIVEPYLKDEKHGKYIDAEVLEKYWEVGGVRIEDNILITKDGIENLTTAPKETADVEALIAGK